MSLEAEVSPHPLAPSPKATQFGHYELCELLYRGQNSVVYRARDPQKQSTFILKVLNTDYPSAAQTARFHHEFHVMRSLDSECIPKAHAWVEQSGRVGIAMEDIGAMGSIDRPDSGASDLDSALNIAVHVAEALLAVHKAHLVHKDIKPHNVVHNPATGRVQLIDYGLATELSSEMQSLAGDEAVEGTLPYIAPEQTGRMNSTVDYRADFYSFGVLLYELCTGQRPFEAKDAIGWTHCHVAKQPAPWQGESAQLPRVLEAIVMKLLSKKKEDRYQSASALLHDLRRCQKQWQTEKKIDTFEIAKDDISSYFQVSQKLYGRDDEIEILLNAFDRVADGHAGELILVAGYSGIGKSALVREVHKPLVTRRGYFIEGKFDQFKSNIPFSAVAQALGDLMRQLLKKPTQELQTWKQAILAELEGQGKVIADIVPELTTVIGPQPEVEHLDGVERLHRLNFLLERFISVFATHEHPLVLFLDDLQWVDAASLSFLRGIMQREDSRYVLLIGAYRDNEVDAAHPLVKTVADLKGEEAIVHTLKLSPLTSVATVELLADTLRANTKSVQDLANLLNRQTGGNPFFLTQSLKSLHDKGLVQFDYDAGIWRWDVQLIEENSGITDNVIELLSEKLQRLPRACQSLLGLAACAGNQFDLAMLAVIAKRPPAVVARDIWPALELEIVLGDGDKLKLVKNMPDRANIDDIGETHLRFLHDRVQQAAYQLITDDKRGAVHLEIGRLLADHYPPEQHEAQRFNIADQLNKGRDLIEDKTERLDLIRLNVLCGKQALRSAAYASAADYLLMARDFLPADAWQMCTELTFTTYLELAQALTLSNKHEEAESAFTSLLDNTKTPEKKQRIYHQQMYHYTFRKDFERAVHAGKQALLRHGIELPETDKDVEPMLAEELGFAANYCEQHGLDHIRKLPVMKSPETSSLMHTLDELGPPCSNAGQKTLFAWVATKMANTSLAHGQHPLSGSGYVQYGIVLCMLGNYTQAETFSKLGIDVAKQFGANSSIARTMYLYAAMAAWNMEPLRHVIGVAEQARQKCLRSGQLMHAGYAAVLSVHSEIEYSIDAAYQKAKRLHPEFKRQYPTMIGFFQAQNLNSITKHTGTSLSDFDVVFAEEEFLSQYQEAPLAISFYLGLNVMDAYLTRQYMNLETLIHSMEYVEANFVGFYFVIISQFFASMNLLATYKEAAEDDRKRYIEIVDKHLASIKALSERCEVNGRQKYLLLEAEKSRVMGEPMERTVRLYRQAIDAAQQSDCLLHEALGNELFGEFWLEHGLEKDAFLYLEEARYVYEKWGGKTKVQQMDETYPQLRVGLHARSTWKDEHAPQDRTAKETDTDAVTSSQLDAETVIKTSQALVSEMQLETLVRKMIHILIENAGAQGGCLLLQRGDTWNVVAAEANDDDMNEFSYSQEVVNYVQQSLESIVLDDAAADSQFGSDPHIQSTQTRSLLCAPMLHQGELKAILYLENNLASGAFTRERVRMVKLIATQAAVSLENARLYSQLVARYQELEHFHYLTCHDLREPTRTLLLSFGKLQGQLEDTLQPKQRRLFSLIRGAVDRMNSLVLGLQELVESDDTTIATDTVDLDHLLQSVIAEAQTSIEQSEAQITWEKLPKVQADEKQIKTLLQNLISNALKFCRGRKPIVRVLADRGKSGWTISVADNGIGIPSDKLGTIFRPFARLHAKGEFEGVGIGLAKCRKILERHGTSLEVESDVGKGSTFRFVLPPVQLGSQITA